MNDEQRAALVDILKTFYGEARYTGTSIITEDARHTRRAIAAIRDLLADRAATVDDDAVEAAAKAIDRFVRDQIAAFDVADMPVSEFWSGQAEDVARAALTAAGTTPDRIGERK